MVFKMGVRHGSWSEVLHLKLSYTLVHESASTFYICYMICVKLCFDCVYDFVTTITIGK